MAGKTVSGTTKLSDVLNAIRVIKTFVDFRERVNKLVAGLCKAGVDIGSINFNNPMSLMRALVVARQSGVDIDIDTMIDEIEGDCEVTMEEVKRSIDIIRKFGNLSRTLDASINAMIKSSKVSSADMDSVLSMFGIKKGVAEEETEDEETEDELTEEDIERMKEIADKYRKEVS